VKFNTAYLNSFVTLYEEGSFSKAAEVLRVTPSAVHQNVDKLQKHFDEGLYTNTSRSVSFTPLGERLYRRANKVLTELESLDTWAMQQKESPDCQVTVVCQNIGIYEATLLPFIPEFTRQYPQIDLKVLIHENVINANREVTDIYWGLSSYLGEMYKGLKHKGLVDFSYGIYASPKYLKKYGEPKNIKDLKGHHIIGNTKNDPSNGLFLRSRLKKNSEMNSIKLNAKVTVTYSHEYLGAQGLGLFNASPNLPIVRELVRKNKIVPVMERYWYKGVPLRTYYQSTRYNQTGVKQCIDFFYSKKDKWDLYE